MRVIGGLLAPGPYGHRHHDAVLAMAKLAGAGDQDVVTAGRTGLFAAEPLHRGSAASGVTVVADLDLTNLTALQRTVGADTAAGALIALYERYGPRFVRELHGGFSIALWDERAQRLLLAVDRFGIARLYHATTNGHTAFATRGDVLCVGADIVPSPEPATVLSYLNFGYVPAPASIYRGIRRLPPGHLLVLGNGEPVLGRYWDLNYTERSLSFGEAAAEVYEQTERAVSRVLHGTSPRDTGAFLSGGTDSSTIVGLMARLTGHRVSAFSIGFSEGRYDELEYATLAARHFGATHYTHVVRPDEALALLPSLVEAYDEPFGNDSAIGTAICARLAARCGVSRLVAGDGGDEIFGGNERYRTDAIFGLYDRLPRPLRTLVIEPLLRLLGDAGDSVAGRAQRYVARARIPNPYRFYSYEFYVLQHADELLAPEFLVEAGRSAPLDVLHDHWAHCQPAAPLNRLLYLDMKLTIGDNDLYKVTRTAELAGMRVAFPLLDPELVDFMAALPARYKVRRLEKRHVFKRAFRELLPPAILGKRKHGFGVPVAAWLREHRGFAELGRDLLLGPSARTATWFRPGAVERLFELHAKEATPFYGGLLWTALMLELWQRRYAGQGAGS